MGEELDIMPQQLEIRLPADLPWDDLVRLGRQVASVSRWILGDLACMAETRRGEASLETFAEEIGVSYDTLRGYKAAAQAFPAESADRSAHSFGAYQALAAHPDRLELVSGGPLTVARARELAGGGEVTVGRQTEAADQANGDENAGKRDEKASFPKRQARTGAERMRASRQRKRQGGFQDGQPYWKALCDPYRALPADQQRAFLDWVPELVSLRERLSDPAWLRERLARVEQDGL